MDNNNFPVFAGKSLNQGNLSHKVLVPDYETVDIIFHQHHHVNLVVLFRGCYIRVCEGRRKLENNFPLINFLMNRSAVLGCALTAAMKK